MRNLSQKSTNLCFEKVRSLKTQTFINMPKMTKLPQNSNLD